MATYSDPQKVDLIEPAGDSGAGSIDAWDTAEDISRVTTLEPSSVVMVSLGARGGPGESTGDTPQQIAPAGCGKSTVGVCGGGNPEKSEVRGYPTVAQLSEEHQVGDHFPVVHRVSRININAVTIRVPILVEGIRAQATIDSGAEVSVLSGTCYQRIPEGRRPPMKDSALTLVVADQEQELTAMGVVNLQVQLKPLTFEWPVHVAPIADDMLLGSNILDAHDIAVSSHRGLLVRGAWVSCETTRRPVALQCTRVRVPQALTIPPHHEFIVPVSLPNPEDEGKSAILEPLVEDSRGLLVARGLVDTGHSTIPVCMVNLSEVPIRLRRHHLLGELQPIQDEVLSLEGADDQGSLSPLAPVPDNVEGHAVAAEADSSEVLEQEAQAVPEHLQQLYRTTARGIRVPSVRRRIQSLLCQRQGAFGRQKLDLGTFSEVQHEINTACAAPVWQRVRPTPRGFENEERACLEEQLEAGVIRPSSSAWAAPTVLVRKSDGSVRWCIDYRKLNDRSVKDAYPLPKISMCLDSLHGARFFSTLDLQSGYWQIEMADKDIPKTTFITKYGLFEYTKMLFGLCSAPSTFQCCMELVFRGLQWKTLLIYLDDLIVIGQAMEENLERLDEVLLRLEQSGLKLKPSKCQILQDKVVFLGHVVSEQGVLPNPKLLESVTDWPVPRCRREVQQFLGLANYYRQFVPGFSDVAIPLKRLTSKEVDFAWESGAVFTKGLKSRVLSLDLSHDLGQDSRRIH